ncbi:uncharacterized protein LOC126996549 [Eriocheir sinensis]|uniref:uncharacterized protein LOC126996549 n=1 Tax=Eriocheir sinensis TaxID=95602 RepID=UPI0021C95976|nr:uncharacterized protein LOC126996549 [Eriocheir sinensis]XP_050713065.1 uncharacterized protein LOC126996549 [Eriocheir sinensis]
MATPTVVTWACLLVVLAAADAVPRPQPPPLPVLREGQPLGSGKPHYLLLETLRPRASANDIQEQDLAASGEPNERFNEEGVWESIALTQLPSLLTSQGFTEGAKVPKRLLWDSSGQEGSYAATINRRNDSKKNVHRRQKRYTIKHKLRSIAVPLSVFNFLGFLPVRVPGLPYHNELPSPDYGHYETKYDVYVPRYRRRKTFRRF